MKKIVFGWMALLAGAFIAAVAVHWTVGIAVITVPVIVTYIRLKRSTQYRRQGDLVLAEVLTDKRKGVSDGDR